MALFRPVLFLAFLSVVAWYLAFSGYRVLKLKALANGGSARQVDWVAGSVAFTASASLAALGWLRPAAVQQEIPPWPASINTLCLPQLSLRIPPDASHIGQNSPSHLASSSTDANSPVHLDSSIQANKFAIVPLHFRLSDRSRRVDLRVSVGTIWEQ